MLRVGAPEMRPQIRALANLGRDQPSHGDEFQGGGRTSLCAFCADSANRGPLNHLGIGQLDIAIFEQQNGARVILPFPRRELREFSIADLAYALQPRGFPDRAHIPTIWRGGQERTFSRTQATSAS